MAIIGRLNDVRNRYFNDRLSVVFDYLAESLMVGSSIHNRIFDRSIDAFERVNLTDKIFALEQVYETKPRDLCFYESHQRYVDFQLHLFGIEQMEWIAKSKVHVKESYDSIKDLITYEDTQEASKIVMKTGDLAIFLPEDVHMGISWFQNKKSKVYKTVVKLPIELYGF